MSRALSIGVKHLSMPTCRHIGRKHATRHPNTRRRTTPQRGRLKESTSAPLVRETRFVGPFACDFRQTEAAQRVYRRARTQVTEGVDQT